MEYHCKKSGITAWHLHLLAEHETGSAYDCLDELRELNEDPLRYMKTHFSFDTVCAQEYLAILKMHQQFSRVLTVVSEEHKKSIDRVKGRLMKTIEDRFGADPQSNQ